MTPLDAETGVVADWPPDRPFGSVRSDRGPAPIFIHRADCPDGAALAPGTKITFRVIDLGRGPRASAVEVLPSGELHATPNEA